MFDNQFAVQQDFASCRMKAVAQFDILNGRTLIFPFIEAIELEKNRSANGTAPAPKSSGFFARHLVHIAMHQILVLRKEIRQKVANHDDEAFLKALHIDRTLVSCPTFAARMARAEIEDDKLFFSNLARALKTRWKKKSPQKKEDHKDLRIMLQATYESGQLQKMSMTEADELFIKELAVYSDDGEDPARSLQRFILRFKNNK